MVVVALKRAIRRRDPVKVLFSIQIEAFNMPAAILGKCSKSMVSFIQSMSRKGDCWDNAVAESFLSILKSELVHGKRFAGPKEALHSIFEYIEIFTQ